ncbi:MAG: hypothetical protein ACE5D2_07095 [Fidelibacterota bacterium]
MNNLLSTLKQHRRQIVIWILILVVIMIALKLGIDEKVVVFMTLILGLFTHVFAGLGAIIAAVPLVGPFIIKVLTIPFFWILNALGYFVSVVAIKKGYSKEVINSRTLTIAVLVGIVIGYILGHLIPLK